MTDTVQHLRHIQTRLSMLHQEVTDLIAALQPVHTADDTNTPPDPPPPSGGGPGFPGDGSGGGHP